MSTTIPTHWPKPRDSEAIPVYIESAEAGKLRGWLNDPEGRWRELTIWDRQGREIVVYVEVPEQ